MDKFLVRKHKLESSVDNISNDGQRTTKFSKQQFTDVTRCKSSTDKLCEKHGDLFSCPDNESLAHCISADARMGKGIAVIFKKKFGGVDDIKSQGQKPGGVAILKRGGRYVYYLVTKEKYFHKPTYDTLQSSLEAMKDHCISHGVTSLSMPRIGCGLDGLQWSRVQDIIDKVFQETDIRVTVYTL
ncbi:ADP-ribose glycohydrolase OARD1-like isoform X1 [Montipora foliosa]|uniref:ADP-ribose glycohydrolase OARD1-like isoform X1 n=1 Tax=Montipora foliosa TaxID=591990 RepID=UPI0035F17B82